MGKKIRVMDLEVDMLAQEQLMEKVMQQFDRSQIGTGIYLTTKMIEKATENEEYKVLLDSFTMLLPGEDEVLYHSHIDILKSSGIVTNCDSFHELLHSFSTQNKSIYIVGGNLSSMEHFFYYCELNFPHLAIAGSFFKDSTTRDETIINDINVACPDVVIVALPSPLQEKWMKENLDKISAKLCFGIGSVLSIILEKYETSDNVMKKHIIVRCLKKLKKILSHSWQRKLFQIELNYYSQRKKQKLIKHSVPVKGRKI